MIVFGQIFWKSPLTISLLDFALFTLTCNISFENWQNVLSYYYKGIYPIRGINWGSKIKVTLRLTIHNDQKLWALNIRWILTKYKVDFHITMIAFITQSRYNGTTLGVSKILCSHMEKKKKNHLLHQGKRKTEHIPQIMSPFKTQIS